MTELETPAPPRRAKWVAGITLICLGIGGIAAWALVSPDAVSYYATPSELRVKHADLTKNLRVGGRVAPDGVHRDGVLISFEVTDGHNAVPVLYRGDVPDTLKADTDVIAEGRFNAAGTLVASRVLAKCSSKFVPKDKPEQLGRA